MSDAHKKSIVGWPQTMLWLVVMAAAAGCGEQQVPITMEAVDGAPGGQVGTLELANDDGEQMLVAPLKDRLMVRPVADESGMWRPVSSQWEAGQVGESAPFFQVAHRQRRAGWFRQERFFITYDERLWALMTGHSGDQTQLVVSEDLGQAWTEVTLPEAMGSSQFELSQGIAEGPLWRLVTAGEDLFLMDDSRVFQWRPTSSGSTAGEEPSAPDDVDEEGAEDGDDDAPASLWEPRSLAGLGLGAEPEADDGNEDRASRRAQGPLPRRLRHYLPATEAHPVEVATVFGRRLQVFRRLADDEEFEAVAELDILDRDLLRVGDGDAWFLVGDEKVYRSTDQGQEWEDLEVTSYVLAPDKFSHLEFFYDDEAEAGYQLWLVGQDGSLWRSEDAGGEWEVVAERDPDRRGVTGVVYDEDRSQWWASTAGRGVLRSDNPGDWQTANGGLRAATAFATAFGEEGQLFIGTDSGLYEHRRDFSGDPGGGAERWRRLDGRATSAIYVDGAQQRRVTGTVGGSIVVRADGDEESASEAAPLGSTEEILFLPPHLRGVDVAPSAIVTLATRQDSRDIIAWSHRQGPMISNDGGSSWRRMQLGEAFRSALEHGVITQFITTASQHYFAVTRSRRADRPAQLWRTADGGQTWQATYSFMEDEEASPMQLVALNQGRGLMMAHGSHLAVSTDRGETWMPLSGDWEEAVITGLTVDDDQAVVVINETHGAEILWIEDPLGQADVARRFRMIWPEGKAGMSDRPVGLEVRGDWIAMTRSGQVYRGTTPRRQTTGSGSIAMLIALASVLLMTALAFGYLRTWER